MSNLERNLWIVTYDIRDPGRLRRVYKTMRAYGDHLQFSVFRCTLSKRQLAQLRADLLVHLSVEEDQVLFVRVGSDRPSTWKRLSTLGTALTHVERICHIV